MKPGSVLLTAGAVFLLATGVRGLARRGLPRRNHWGRGGGPHAYPPIRGRAAVAWSLGLIATSVALLAWWWLP